MPSDEVRQRLRAWIFERTDPSDPVDPLEWLWEIYYARKRLEELVKND